jgi:excisionase family DNA binding protein
MAEPDPVSLYTDPKWLRSAQVADLLNVNAKTVNRWAREGRLPFQRTLGGHRRYEERVIRGLAASMVTPATVGPAAGGGSR